MIIITNDDFTPLYSSIKSLKAFRKKKKDKPGIRVLLQGPTTQNYSLKFDVFFRGKRTDPCVDIVGISIIRIDNNLQTAQNIYKKPSIIILKVYVSINEKVNGEVILKHISIKILVNSGREISIKIAFEIYC